MLTPNGQLADKVQELFVVSDDLANLIESSEIATVFLDTELRIKWFTTTAARPFNLQPSDVGRLIGQSRTSLEGIDLERDCQAILDGATSLEREATALDGSKYLLRLFPYRRADRRVTWGVVVTLLDVTRLLARQAADLITERQGQELLSRTNQRLELRSAERMKWLTLLHHVTRAIQDAPTWDEAVRAALELICAAERWQVGFVYIPDPADPDVIVPTIGCLRDERFRSFYELSEIQHYRRRQNLPGARL